MTSIEPSASGGAGARSSSRRSNAGRPALPRNNCTALAEFACALSYEDIPADVIHKEKVHILDGIGNGLCGAASDFGQSVMRYLDHFRGEEEAVVWGTGRRVNCAQAAFANASFSNYGELEDAHFRTKFKPNTVLSPAAIALADRTGASGKQILTALIAANEVCLRIAIATHVGTDGYARGWIGTSSMGAFGSAIIAGRLLGFDIEQMAQGIALAGAQPCGIWSGGMAMSKRVMIGKAAENGILAAYMAAEGITGGFDVFDGDWGTIGDIISPEYERDKLTKDFGEHWFTREIGLECYPTKGGAHSAIDCVLDILSRGRVDPDQIKDILVRATSGIAKNRALSLFPPHDFYEAQNSMPYILAVTLIDGVCELEQFTDHKIADPAILALAAKVRITPDPEADKLSPKTKTTFVDITLHDGRVLTSRVDYCKGEPENFLTQDEVRAKFKRAGRYALADARLDEVIGLAERLETIPDLRTLTALLEKN
jgi:2-methylcitrate dehydratase PrpD